MPQTPLPARRPAAAVHAEVPVLEFRGVRKSYGSTQPSRPSAARRRAPKNP